MDRRGRLLGSLNQSRRDGPALAALPRFLAWSEPVSAAAAGDARFDMAHQPVANRPPITTSRRPASRPWLLRTAALLALTGIAVAGLQFATPGPRAPSEMAAHVDRWLVAKGLGIDQVSLEGHRFTTDADIFDALDLLNAGSMLRFNGTEAANRILRLPWVQRVQIKPLVPNGLHVVITERTPYAVWEHEGRRQLIDKSGHRLATIGPSNFTELPRVRGDGAHTAIADLHATLSLFPAIETRLAVAERVGGRRWALVLTNGLKVLLPSEHDAAAIQRLAALQAGSKILDRDLAEIDLRGQIPSVRLASRGAGADAGFARAPANSPGM